MVDSLSGRAQMYNHAFPTRWTLGRFCGSEGRECGSRSLKVSRRPGISRGSAGLLFKYQPPLLTHRTKLLMKLLMRRKCELLRRAKSLLLLVGTAGFDASGAQPNPRPHADQGNQPKRQLVGFSMPSERRCRMPLPQMPG